MWFGGTGCLTFLALILIVCTGGAIIPIAIIGFVIYWFVSMLDVIAQDQQRKNKRR